MASPTPGSLLKLLQSMSNSTPSSTTDNNHHHRSPILQITAIAPSTADLSSPATTSFYLQLSDSLNSTYVSLLSSSVDSLHIGQLVHLDRLLPSHPLPIAHNLRPLPLSRSPILLGSPTPLLALSSPSNPSNFVIQPASAASSNPPPPTTAASSSAKRRFSSPSPSPSPAAAAAAKLSGKRRMPSPAPSAARSGSRSSSPVPSKCVVPSLAVAAAKEESRKNAREPAIVVPSRYRQPSPGGGRRGSMSPGGRRLSAVGCVGESGGSGSGKKKVGVVGIARVPSSSSSSSDGLMVGRGLRKSWEDNSGEEKVKEKVKVKKSKLDQQSILRTQVAMSQRLCDGGKEQPNSEEVTPKIEKQRISIKAEVPAASEMLKHLATKITVHDRKWTDGSVPFDTVSENLGRLGKEALQRRNAASIAAAVALEEALATESLIRCLSMFSNLCSSSKAGNPLPTIDRFLCIYEDAMKWIPICESLLPNAHNEVTSTDQTKPSSVWVEAALATDLQVVSLLDGNFSGKPSVPPTADPSRSSFTNKNHSSLGNTHAKTQTKATNNTWTSGQGAGETLNFAKSLRQEMQIWFMKFVEDALDVGFRLFGAEFGGFSDNARVAAILSQLKRVNEWLDDVGTMPKEEVVLVEEKIERLKRKIYGFVITHIESAFDSSVSLTNKAS